MTNKKKKDINIPEPSEAIVDEAADAAVTESNKDGKKTDKKKSKADNTEADIAESEESKKLFYMDKNTKSWLISGLKSFAISLFRWIVLIGVAYVIIGPVLGIVSRSFFSDADNYNTMVYMIPQSPTTERYKVATEVLNYGPTVVKSLLYAASLMLIQVLMCSMAGYGFARYEFPLKKLLFAFVVLMIVMPTHTIMLPLYTTFSNFDVFGIIKLTTGSTVNLLGTPAPIYIMTFFACGLRSGLYIYIFTQFFRGLPKEIEEAAFVDGAGMWYTYFRIMLRNATPAAITVAIFSMVWQYNDTFYARLFHISDDIVISKRISGLESTVSNIYKIYDSNILELYLDAGIVLIMLPIVILYILLQKQFIEGVERSGIVG